MTKREAAIVSLYTGYLIGSFSDVQMLASELLGRPVFTHELVDEELQNEMMNRAKPLFVSMEVK